MNWMPQPEDEQPEDEQPEDGSNPKRKELSDKERFDVYFALRVIEIKSGSVQPNDKFIVSSLLSIGIRAVERIWEEAKK